MHSPSPAKKKTLKIKGPSLFPLQQQICQHPARFKVVLGGRRFGKTRVGAGIALETIIQRKPLNKILHTVKKGGLVWWVAPVYSQSEIVFELLKPLIEKIPGAKVKESKLCFLLPSGGELWCKSADKPDRLRGRGLDGLVIDEADFIDGELWSKTLRPALSDRKGWALFLSSPNKRGGWFHKLFKLGQSGKNPAWMSWHCPSWTNPHLDPAEIEAAKEDMTEEEWRQEYGAEYVDSHELVYFNFDEDLHVRPCPHNPKLPVHIGLDFNNHPRVAVFVQREGDVFRVVGEVYHPTPATTAEHANLVSAWLKGKGRKPDANDKWGKQNTAIPDSSGKSLRHDGRTDILDFQDAGFTLEYPSTNPPLKDRDGVVLAYLKNANKQVRLLIDPSCKHVIEAFKEFKHKGRNESPYGHVLDALGYVIWWLTRKVEMPGPSSVPRPSSIPQRQSRAFPL